jgi:hypothetical protein
VIRPLVTFALVSSALAEPIDFSKQIRPILSENCFFCHGPDEKNARPVCGWMTKRVPKRATTASSPWCLETPTKAPH